MKNYNTNKKQQKEKLSVVKIGGNIIEDPIALEDFLKDFSAISEPKVLVHGGGKIATQFAAKLGVKTEMIDGRRITNAQNLEVVVMTYAGLINKTIVSGLQKYDCNAIGLTGSDANVLTAHKRPVQFIDYGYVGDIQAVNATVINGLLALGLTPVFCSVTHDEHGQLLNTNADTIASSVAAAMEDFFEVSLFYCFELPGVLKNIKDEESVIEHINLQTYSALRDQNVISAGMLPKLQNCFEALHNKVSHVHIGNTQSIQNKTIKHTTLSL